MVMSTTHAAQPVWQTVRSSVRNQSTAKAAQKDASVQRAPYHKVCIAYVHNWFWPPSLGNIIWLLLASCSPERKSSSCYLSRSTRALHCSILKTMDWLYNITLLWPLTTQRRYTSLSYFIDGVTCDVMAGSLTMIVGCQSWRSVLQKMGIEPVTHWSTTVFESTACSLPSALHQALHYQLLLVLIWFRVLPLQTGYSQGDSSGSSPCWYIRSTFSDVQIVHCQPIHLFYHFIFKQFVDDGCIPAEECACYHNGVEYPPGTVVEIYCQNW